MITIGPNGGVLDVIGSNTVLTLTGPLTSQGTLTVNNPNDGEGAAGMLVFTNNNNSFDPVAGAVRLSFGTLSVNSPACLGTAPINFVGQHDGSTLRFAAGGTYANNMSFPPVGQKPIYFDTDGNNITLTGDLTPSYTGTTNTVDIHITGSGSLTFAFSQPGPGNMGSLYIDQGTSVVFSTSAYSSYAQNDSPFGGHSPGGAGGGYTYVSPGANLQLANAQLGVNADVATNGIALPTIDLDSGSGGTSTGPGATFVGSGSSSYINGSVEVVLNYSGTAPAVINNIGTPSVSYGTGLVSMTALSARQRAPNRQRDPSVRRGQQCCRRRRQLRRQCRQDRPGNLRGRPQQVGHHSHHRSWRGATPGWRRYVQRHIRRRMVRSTRECWRSVPIRSAPAYGTGLMASCSTRWVSRHWTGRPRASVELKQLTAIRTCPTRNCESRRHVRRGGRSNQLHWGLYRR